MKHNDALDKFIDENIRHNKHIRLLFITLIAIDICAVSCIGFITWYLFS